MSENPQNDLTRLNKSCAEASLGATTRWHSTQTTPAGGCSRGPSLLNTGACVFVPGRPSKPAHADRVVIKYNLTQVKADIFSSSKTIHGVH